MAAKLSLKGREWEDELFASMAKVQQQPLAPDLPEDELSTPHGEDGILDLMRAHNIPLTRKAYLSVAGLTEPLGIELEMELPEQFRLSVTPVKRPPAKKARSAVKKK
jgi:hypothetical protein